MAKRKRLTPAPRPEYMDAGDPLDTTGLPADLETKGYPNGVLPVRTFQPPERKPAPIAGVAGDAATRAALDEVTAEIETARAEGRMIQALPLAAIETDYLVRDRMAVAEDEMASLMTSIAARGQQTPIEVVAREGGRFGLISGWRRMQALSRLHHQTGEDRFAAVQAIVRRPDSAAEAYVAMIEENEIRVGLSYYERARIVARAVEEGIYRDAGTALGALFASASRSKRSKIRSFLPLVSELGAHLRFPQAIAERQGLDLAGRLKDADFAFRLKDRLRKAAPADAAAEQALLARALKGDAETPRARAAPRGEELRRGVFVNAGKGRLTIEGPGLTEADVAAIRALLQR